MRAYTHVDAAIGPKRSFTPEGFLFCEDVALARTGIQVYLPSEIEGIPAGPDGLIHVERRPEDVFTEKALASFVAKPVTDNHPSGNLDPQTYRNHARGSILNPRRGTGDQSDLMIGDLLICDREAIQAILDGKREVSCGYTAEYEVIGPGRARQHDIIGNHVALVTQGRCGGRCAIGDEDTMADGVAQTRVSKITWKDQAKAAAVIGDMDALDKALAAAGSAEGGTAHHVHVNINKPSPAKGATRDDRGDKDEDEDEDEDDDKKKRDTEDSLKKALGKVVADAIKPLAARLDKLEKRRTRDEKGDKDDADDKDEEEEVDEEGEDDKKKPTGDKKKTGDAQPMVYTKDQLPDIIQDTTARAELLMPGIRLPALDAKGDPKVVTDAICAARRNTLTAAMMLPKSQDIITPLMKNQPAFDRMTCEQIATVFTAASENMKVKNNGLTGGGTGTKSGVRKVGDQEFSGPITPAEINARNAAFHRNRQPNKGA